MWDEFPENMSQQNFNLTEMTWKIWVLLYLAVYDHHKKKKAVLIELGTYKVDGQWCCFSMESCSLFICSVLTLGGVRGAILYYRAPSIVWIWSGNL